MLQAQQRLIRFLNLIGFFSSRKGRGILFIDNRVLAKFNEALIAELTKEYPRENIFHQSPSLDHFCYPNVVQIFKPCESRFAIRKMLSRLKISLVFIGAGTNVTKLFIDLARENGASIVMTGLPDMNLEYLSSIDYFLIHEPSGVTYLQGMGIDSNRIFMGENGDLQAGARKSIKLVGPRINNAIPGTDSKKLIKYAGRIISHRLFKPLFDIKYTPINSIGSLKTALDNPACILCLGNGPSSVGSHLDQIAYDALFRVNHLWLKHGYLSHPDMIFTGLKSTVKSYKEKTIFGFQTLAREEDMLVKCLPIPRKLKYATAERLGSVNYRELDQLYQPTNGLVMLATAVALQPKKIVIAGIDLFQHPSGAYPADTVTPNAYTLAHDRDMEQTAILEVLDKFKGELVILSEVLEVKWKEFLANQTR